MSILGGPRRGPVTGVVSPCVGGLAPHTGSNGGKPGRFCAVQRWLDRELNGRRVCVCLCVSVCV